MPNIFIISDTHFSHASTLKFFRANGKRLRDFETVEEMDEHMVERWNSVVRPQDHVYHLGDVVINRRALPICSRLNGHKRLVRGNHDEFKTKDYLQYFDEIYGVRILDNMIMSHIPLHPSNIKQRWLCNIHGHLHANTSDTSFTPEYGNRYFNVSVEVLNYTPISLEEIKKTVIGWGK